jgi:hypothetical protein
MHCEGGVFEHALMVRLDEASDEYEQGAGADEDHNARRGERHRLELQRVHMVMHDLIRNGTGGDDAYDKGNGQKSLK